MVSSISRDFLFLAIKLNCSDGFSSKTYILKIAFVSENVQSFKKFTEGDAKKSPINFAFSGYADVIKYQEKLSFYVNARRSLKLASSARARS